MKHKQLFREAWTLSLLLSMAVFLPSGARAQTTASNLSDMFNNGAGEIGSLSFVLSVLSYILGITCGFLGVRRLLAWVDGQAPISEGVWRLVGSACLVAAPWTASTVLNSLYSSYGSTYTFRNAENGATQVAATGGNYVGLDQVIVNLVANIYEPAEIISQAVCYITGVGCLINGIYRLAQAGQAASGRAPKPSGTVGYILGGAVMLSLGDLMSLVTNSLFGQSNTSTFTSLAYSVGGINMTQANNVAQALFAFVEIIGWIAFIRGTYILIRVAQGNGGGTHGQAFTHLSFGALAVNLPAFVRVLQTTLGISPLIN